MTEFALAHPWLATLIALVAIMASIDWVRLVAWAVVAIVTGRAP